MTGRLGGKVALITGSARGQGRSHARRFAEEGADVMLIDSCTQIDSVPYPMATAADLAQTVREVESLGCRAVSFQVDVRDVAALAEAVGQGVDALGRLDVVSANAGIVSGARSTAEIELQAWNDVIDVNLTGVWHTVRASLPHMVGSGRGGSVVLTSSTAGLMGIPNIGHYVAAKHGVVGLMRSLAVELAPERIRVNSVHPTNVDTPMIQNEAVYRFFLPEVDSPTREQFEQAARSIQAMDVPWVESIDVSNALVFLASDEARYITGVALPVDAGTLVL